MFDKIEIFGKFCNSEIDLWDANPMPYWKVFHDQFQIIIFLNQLTKEFCYNIILNDISINLGRNKYLGDIVKEIEEFCIQYKR